MSEQEFDQSQNRIIWHNPKDDTLYFGTAYMSYGPEPTYERPVYSIKTAKKAKAVLKTGKRVEDLGEDLNPWHPEYRQLAAKYSHALRVAKREGKSNIRSAGVLTNSDISTINLVNVMPKVLGLEFPNRVLVESINSFDTPSTLLSVDVGTPYEGHAKAGELYVPEPNRQTYTRTSFDLPKDLAVFGVTDEAQNKAAHPVFQLHVENAPSVLRKIENKTIATLIETATDASKGDWGARTSGIPDRDALDDFRATLDTISGNGGDLSNYSIASHNQPWNDFLGNTKGVYNAQKEGVGGTGRIVTTSLLPGATWYIDNDKTSTICSVFSRDAFLRANGPTMVAQWRDEYRMVENYRAAHFTQAKLLQTGRARDMTSVSA